MTNDFPPLPDRPALTQAVADVRTGNPEAAVLRRQVERLEDLVGQLEHGLEVERMQHEETKGYRQHAEQERDELAAEVKRLKSEVSRMIAFAR